MDTSVGSLKVSYQPMSFVLGDEMYMCTKSQREGTIQLRLNGS